MFPELFRIGSFSVSPFGMMVALAFVAGYYELRRGLRFLKLGDEETASSLIFLAGFGGILGAKLYYAVLYGDPALLLERSGFVWYGGFLLASALLIWWIRRHRLPPWRTVDAMAPALALGYAVGRVGCFLVGDDYGTPSNLPWAVAFPKGLPPTTAGTLRDSFGVELPGGIADWELVAVHPTQLYETLLALVIWGVGLWLLRRGLRDGATAQAVLALLACERFAIEFLRAKDDRLWEGIFGSLGLTVAQLISLSILLLLGILSVRRRATSSLPDSAPAERPS